MNDYKAKVEFDLKAKNFQSALKKMEAIKAKVEKTAHVHHTRLEGVKGDE